MVRCGIERLICYSSCTVLDFWPT